ncbi:MAG TPA: PASTA domain-containing protein [Acidimicrobiales bacterium]|nr:PASTA domain-containing protein [Acidimicrobiales bacterium]
MTTITDQIGRVLAGRYRLDAGLGTGASAHVYAAYDTRLHRRVAVKLLHPGLNSDRAFLRRFRAEAQAVAALNHPNLVRVFDWGEEEDGPFLVLEYLAGGSLRDLLDSGARLSPAQAAAVGARAAHGLAYAHRRGLVHRDVKPANLLFDEDGGVRVADFGLARALAEAAWTEPAGAVLGTARYASPEQAEGRALDDRSDVYSLALVLFESVTGRVPFSGETTFATLMARVGAVLPPAPELGPLSPILAQAAIGEPLARLGAAELATDLELAARSLPAPERLPLAPRVVLPEPVRPREEGAPRASDGSAHVAGGRSARVAASPPATPTEEGRDDLTIPWPSATPHGAAPPGGDVRRSPRGGWDAYFEDDEGDGEAFAAAPTEDDRAPDRRAGRPPRRSRPVLRRLLVALVVVLALLAGAGAVVRFVVFGHTIPRLVGKGLADARAETATDGMQLRVTGRVYSGAVAAGDVLSQSPAPGKAVRAGVVVAVVVSEGHAPVQVPSVAGTTKAAASAALGAVHLRASEVAVYSETVPAGSVVSATPSSGSASYGATVRLKVSEGPRPRTIPELAPGATWASAGAALTAERLVPVEALAYSDAVAAGEVISTAPAEGARGIPVGTKVTVTVSRGPRLVSVPQVVNDPISQAIALLQQHGLDVTEQVGPPFATHATTTDPPAGARVRPGSAVTLYVA